MLASDAGTVVGMALQDWKAGEGTILVLASRGWIAPAASAAEQRAMAEAIHALRTELAELRDTLEDGTR